MACTMCAGETCERDFGVIEEAVNTCIIVRCHLIPTFADQEVSFAAAHFDDNDRGSAI